MIGNGKYLKNQLNNNAEIARVIIATKNADVLWVAQLLIFSAVLIKTAVAGNHHIIQLHIFDSANHNTSLSLSNLSFVIFSAILADIIVSRIAIIAITNEVVNNILARFTTCFISEIWKLKGFWNNVKLKLVYLSDNNKILGKFSLAIIQKIIQMIVNNITAGNVGLYFLNISKNHNQSQNNINETISTLDILLKTSNKFIYISLCWGIFNAGLFSHNHQLICHNAIVIQTDIKNQWSTVDGISVMYLVIFNKYMIYMINHEHIAKSGNKATPFSPLANTNVINILDNAHATQNIL
jgi:hypothetical protein